MRTADSADDADVQKVNITGVARCFVIQFNPFPMTAPQTTINGQGELEFEFSVPDNAAFFRLEAR